MSLENVSFKRISPWMRNYVWDGSEIFTKYPRNDGHYYFVVFALTLALMIFSYSGLLNSSAAGGRAGLFLFVVPFVALYALVKLLWCRFGRTELSLGDQITKKMKIGRICFGWERWLWPEVQSVWVQEINSGTTNKTPDYQGTVYLKCNNKRQKVLGDLFPEEAESLLKAIESRLKLRGSHV